MRRPCFRRTFCRLGSPRGFQDPATLAMNWGARRHLHPCREYPAAFKVLFTNSNTCLQVLNPLSRGPLQFATTASAGHFPPWAAWLFQAICYARRILAIFQCQKCVENHRCRCFRWRGFHRHNFHLTAFLAQWCLRVDFHPTSLRPQWYLVDGAREACIPFRNSLSFAGA